MLSSQITEPTTAPKTLTFPRLMVSTQTGAVYLIQRGAVPGQVQGFTVGYTNPVNVPHKRPMSTGDFRGDLDFDFLEDFHGAVTLQNED